MASNYTIHPPSGNLGVQLSSRYQRTGDERDLEAAIIQIEEAVDTIPKDHPYRAALLTILGLYLNIRYQQTGNLEDSEAAIDRSEAVVDAAPEGHPERASSLNNLGLCFSSRYEKTRNMQDLEAAINRSEEAVEAAPEGHPDRASLLNSLAHHFNTRPGHETSRDISSRAQAYSTPSINELGMCRTWRPPSTDQRQQWRQRLRGTLTVQHS